MRKLKLSVALILIARLCFGQTAVKNVVIITTDGYRWQELFKGVDGKLANDKKFNQNNADEIQKKYGAENNEASRLKLMPFMWGTIAKKGQIYGSRDSRNFMDVSNRYWFSYPGYNEILTGYPDKEVNSNSYKDNPNENLLDFLDKQPGFKGKVAAYAAWDAFDRIFNKPRAGYPVVAAFDNTGGDNPTEQERLLNKMRADSYKPFGMAECLDVFTHYSALEYMKKEKPRALYISYGETDEWAHEGRYRDYLDAAHQVDQWIGNIWNYIQSDPFYKDQTALVITTDHGRGEGPDWTDHGRDIKGANEIWLAILGPGITAKGEIKQPMKNYQKQIAQTVASLLNLKFTSPHPVGDKINIK